VLAQVPPLRVTVCFRIKYYVPETVLERMPWGGGLHKEEGDVLEDSHDSVRNEISTNIAQL
jgi:hypothetical protein